jgi:hypothetical protein
MAIPVGFCGTGCFYSELRDSTNVTLRLLQRLLRLLLQRPRMTVMR